VGVPVERVLQQRVVEGARRRARDRVLAKSTIPHAAPPRITITTTSPVTAEIATVPVAPSPHRAVTTATERLIDRHGPLRSSASTGMTKNVATAQAAPAIHTAILAASGIRSCRSRRTSPIVAATRVQPRIGPSRCMAARIRSPTVVSSPRSERAAQAASATLKKTAMNVETYAVAAAAM